MGHSADGYGRCAHGPTGSTFAHVANWIAVNGPVPDGCELDHLCRVRNCVNPDHLEPVSRFINIQRSNVAKLTPSDVVQIRAMVDTHKLKEIANTFGISISAVFAIKHRKSWPNIP